MKKKKKVEKLPENQVENRTEKEAQNEETRKTELGRIYRK